MGMTLVSIAYRTHALVILIRSAVGAVISSDPGSSELPARYTAYRAQYR